MKTVTHTNIYNIARKVEEQEFIIRTASGKCCS